MAGFFPLSSSEIVILQEQVDALPESQQLVFSREDVGRLLATVEWYQRREADFATRLGNSQCELDVLLSDEELETLE